METQIVFTPSILVGTLIAISAFVVAMDKLLGVILKAMSKARAPEKRQDEDIAMLTEEQKRISALLDRDDKRLRVLEDGVNVLIKGQLALLGHAVDGNNETECKKARNEIYEHLMQK